MVKYFYLLGSICFVIGSLLDITGAGARDPGGKYAQQDPKMHKWFEGLKSGKGPCCSDADGTALSDVDWRSVDKTDVHYQVRIDGDWIDVPDEAVLTQPNLYGRTMVWPIRGYLGITIRCFIVGAQG
jgi:hypothetical protein